MYGDDELIQIIDEESGDTYFYEVEIEIDNVLTYIDIRQFILEGMEL